MIICNLCSKEILVKELKNSFQITLGNAINGKFSGQKMFFYHLECLMGNQKSEKQLKTKISELN